MTSPLLPIVLDKIYHAQKAPNHLMLPIEFFSHPGADKYLHSGVVQQVLKIRSMAVSETYTRSNLAGQ